MGYVWTEPVQMLPALIHATQFIFPTAQKRCLIFSSNFYQEVESVFPQKSNLKFPQTSYRKRAILHQNVFLVGGEMEGSEAGHTAGRDPICSLTGRDLGAFPSGHTGFICAARIRCFQKAYQKVPARSLKMHQDNIMESTRGSNVNRQR